MFYFSIFLFQNNLCLVIEAFPLNLSGLRIFVGDAELPPRSVPSKLDSYKFYGDAELMYKLGLGGSPDLCEGAGDPKSSPVFTLSFALNITTLVPLAPRGLLPGFPSCCLTNFLPIPTPLLHRSFSPASCLFSSRSLRFRSPIFWMNSSSFWDRFPYRLSMANSPPPSFFFFCSLRL